MPQNFLITLTRINESLIIRQTLGFYKFSFFSNAFGSVFDVKIFPLEFCFFWRFPTLKENQENKWVDKFCDYILIREVEKYLGIVEVT